MERSYSGLLTLGSFQDYEKAPERTYSANRNEEQAQEAVENTSMDMSAELDYDEEIPFE